MVKDKRVEGISDIRDESSREGMRVVITLKKGENAQVILNRLYKYTQMQVSFGIIMLALDARNQPKMWTLKEMLEAFIEHRKDVVTRRCIYDLKKAEAKAHILEGLKKALDHIDEVIATIKASKEVAAARSSLMSKFGFTEKQAQAILDMRLQKITGLERDKITKDLEELMKHITWLKKVLSDVAEIYKIIKEELQEIREKYATPRRTKIEAKVDDFTEEDLITSEDMFVAITNSGYIKRIPQDEYRVQKRGGKGLKGATNREEDYVETVFSANTLTTVLCVSDRGKLYWLKVHRIPQGSRTARGRAIANVLSLASGEKIKAFIPVNEFSSDKFITFVTEQGVIKKTPLDAFSRPRPSGIIALTTNLDDHLRESRICDSQSHIFISTSQGMSIRFDNNDVRPMGRTAKGVKGITLGRGNDRVVGMDIIPAGCTDTMLVVTKNGYGKRASLDEYRTQGRGGVGIITQKVNEKVGEVIGVRLVKETDQVMIMTDQGQSIRMQVSDISVLGRNTQGVRLINLKAGEQVSDIALIADESQEEGSGEEEKPTLQ